MMIASNRVEGLVIHELITPRRTAAACNEVLHTPSDLAVASQLSSPAPALISASKLIAAMAPLANRMRAVPSPIISAARRSTSGLWPTQHVLASPWARDHS